MTKAPELEFDQLLEQIEDRERGSRRRVLWFIVIPTVALLLLALIFMEIRNADLIEIIRVRDEIGHLTSVQDSIYIVVATTDSMQHLFRQRLEAQVLDADNLRKVVAALEQERAQERLSVRELNTADDLELQLVETFAEVARSMRISEVFQDGSDLEYLMVPLSLSGVLMTDHENAMNYAEQISTTQLYVDSLQQDISVLRDILSTLEREKSQAFQDGFDLAIAQYDTLNMRYINLLDKPPSVSIFSNKHAAFISGAMGVVVGVAVGAIIKD